MRQNKAFYRPIVGAISGGAREGELAAVAGCVPGHMVNNVSQLNVFDYKTCTSCAKFPLKIGLEVSSQRGNLGDFYSDYSLTFVSSFVARTFEQRRLFIDRPHRFSLKF